MENSNIIKLDNHYQISLPQEICQQLSLKPGDELLLDTQGKLLILQAKPKNIVNYLAGLHKDVWQNIDPQKYLTEERNQWSRSNN
ncbi:AbrB/MazE/SpoVT family DNA-binding domain-containing protein [Candidatus Leptofilum sp.]|uniref:AbrB/MazE/SpoVT family DNA-binding domain-containing protein n=1 Tax=Candidatus Leptofilum sp. TaxID=3241576 RepID=UPI003B5B1B51